MEKPKIVGIRKIGLKHQQLQIVTKMKMSSIPVDKINFVLNHFHPTKLTRLGSQQAHNINSFISVHPKLQLLYVFWYYSFTSRIVQSKRFISTFSIDNNLEKNEQSPICLERNKGIVESYCSKRAITVQE